MAFLTLEDIKGFVEVILFPEVFKAALPHLRGGDPLLIKGTLDSSEDHVKIKGTEVHSLSGVPLLATKPLHLRIPVSSLAPSQLTDLRDIIVANRGPSRVLLHFMGSSNQEVVVALSDQYRVDPSQHFRNHVQNAFKSVLISTE
jgi:DNA polymerase-3 subunit alpha